LGVLLGSAVFDVDGGDGLGFAAGDLAALRNEIDFAGRGAEIDRQDEGFTRRGDTVLRRPNLMGSLDSRRVLRDREPRGHRTSRRRPVSPHRTPNASRTRRLLKKPVPTSPPDPSRSSL
jgi:hypothetical protein